MPTEPQDYNFSALHKEIGRFRDHINIPRVSRLIMANTKDWNQLCSAMDLLGDNLYAIDDYVNQNWPKSEGVLYLLIYGVLQALILQQDAVEQLALICNVHYDRNPKLEAIRELRHKSSGHPSKRGGIKKTGEDTRTSHFISRISLKHGHYQLMSSRKDSEDFVFEDINLFALIKLQQELLLTDLSAITNQLVKKDTEHKERFRDVKLAKLLSDAYTVPKLFESLDRPDIRPQAAAHVDFLIKALFEFREHLSQRGELSSSWEEEIGYIEYPLTQLKLYFTGSPDNKLNDKDARIFIEYVRFASNSLIDMAEEVDQDYET